MGLLPTSARSHVLRAGLSFCRSRMPSGRRRTHGGRARAPAGGRAAAGDKMGGGSGFMFRRVSDEVYRDYEAVLCKLQVPAFQDGRAYRASPYSRRLEFRGESAWGRLAWLWAVSAFVASLAVPGLAYGLDDNNFIIYGPNEYTFQNITTGEVGIIANNQYDAALVLLGENPNDEKFTSAIKAKLSNSSTGHDFYNLAQRFSHPSVDGGTATETGVNPGFWSTCFALYGHDKTWFATYRRGLFFDAKRDLETILAGGGSSGGGSSGGSGPAVEDGLVFLEFHDWAPGKPSALSAQYICITETDYTWLSGASSDPLVFSYVGKYLSSDASYVMCCADGNSVTADDSDYTLHFTNTSGRCLSNYRLSVVTINGKLCYDARGARQRSSLDIYSTPTDKHAYGSPVYQVTDLDGSGGGTPSVPETNWPDDPDPDYGTPPELPDPVNPIPGTEPGNPQNPVTPSPPQEPGNPTSPIVPSPPQEPGNPQNPTVPTPPTLPNPTTYTGGTYTIDIQGILDAMDEHCIHLQNCITSNFSGYWSSISTLISNEFANLKTYLQTLTESVNVMIEWLAEVIDGEFSYQNTYMNSLATAITNKLGWLGNMLHADLGYQNTYLQQVATSINDNIQWLGELVADYFESMAEYLHDLFEWLAEQFDFSVSGSGYNDDTVVSWLKKIWSKLGSGTRSRPADPVSDPVGTGGWLDTLFNNLVTALTDLFPGLLEELLGGLGELTSKFPFSIPWDVAALLGLLVATPECPSVEIPAYTYDGTSIVQAGSYEIDLEEYDEVWGGVRMMMKVAFVMYVLVHTKDFMAVIEKVVSPDA